MFVGMINDGPFLTADTRETCLQKVFYLAVNLGYKIRNYDYEGPNRATLDDDGVFVYVEEVPHIKED